MFVPKVFNLILPELPRGHMLTPDLQLVTRFLKSSEKKKRKKGR